jgi:hypothetical protein
VVSVDTPIMNSSAGKLLLIIPPKPAVNDHEAGSSGATLMEHLYSLKCLLLGLQAQSDVAREVFPTRVTRGLYRILGKDSGGSFTSLF